MPDSTHRLRCALALAAGLVCLGACSGRAPDPAPAPDPLPAPPQEVVTSLWDDTLRQARAELERGESLARDGQWPEARRAFDRAVDLLLYAPGGVETSEEAKALYGDILSTVHEMEREYQAQLADDAIDGVQDEAAVDELTTDAARIEEAAPAPAPDLAEAAVSEAVYDIPMEINARVLAIIEMFQTEKRDWFQEALDRGALYLPLFHQVLSEEGIPKDLVYLSMIESAFKPRAVSRMGARGLWQFIAGTGKLYGLRQDYWVDDRFDPEKATRAAARHLKDLYDEFGDWYLAMAAYNAGPRRIERAVRRSGNTDFWMLADKRHLPRETRSYVPLILAATIIAKNPEAYGFTRPAAVALEYEIVELDGPVDLETAANSAGTTVDEMKLLNPELRHWVTPLDRKSYSLKIPKGKTATFTTALAAIPEGERVKFGVHVVERGDTLSQIARKYGTSVEALSAANRLRARTRIHPGQVLTVPVPPGALGNWTEPGRRASRIVEREAVPEGDGEVYVVAHGDTLGAIADSFRMPLSELRALNGLPADSTLIVPGQRLLVSPGAAPAPVPAATAATEKSPRIATAGGDTYLVRAGDTLGGIADAHGIGLSTLRRLNGMSRGATRIYPGQKLVVGEGSGPVAALDGDTAYRVRRGDSLSTIARRFGVSVDELRRWNQIESDHLVIGQSITIRASSGGGQ